MANLINGEILQLLSEHNLLVKTSNLDLTASYTGITYNSRTAESGSLFFCKGNFKPEYLKDAKNHGASAYVSEVEYADVELPAIIVNNVQKTMSLISAAFFGFPQNKLTTIAYTGTKGKTTSSYFTKNILDHQYSVGLFSTIDTIVGKSADDKFKSSLTTPESLDLFTNMNQVVNNGLDHLVMEVSSQAYKKNRVYGLHYDVGVFLNISPDHIGRNEHPTFADYLHCKEQLLVNSSKVVINADGSHLLDTYMTAKATTQPEDIYLFAKKGSEQINDFPIDFVYETLSDTLEQNKINLNAVSDKANALSIAGEYEIGLPGDYNESNAVATAIASALVGATQENIKLGLSRIVIPGRMEHFATKGHGTVYVDYAHNYASMDSVLSFLKSQNPDSKVFVVTGSAGDKGIDRRPGLGKAIGASADVAILTSDDPGYENPKDIADTIADNINNDAVNVRYIEDRKEAILTAINESNVGDVVLIAGKGRDPYQKINGVDTSYDGDAQIVATYSKEV
ncbi:UDP-N-acetylmuramoyl-L-alanyl-D-glutamate--2,6-diaminopimelate ligase [Lentilactobacillus sp. SPB1-3]|uniref:UDP-N-acetylmuramoyl-L-alanyl-D-glutamate--2, 6-diaminopimelate ligase n=1 Tax=Lentilactobacillus terminaliae TaxID=3003483 RepID=A0ACD5DGP3_9LACO|nr:UDP-N-acetylmuramoyl-L-alanyl-D-glutamate--2,6-diaminopimelate ligase [Lentilactobacillus sp. SPB1-3]MCZ0977040.1 UDP-N-acetylmuramoyl-L-alanyl-D-glutamate--2,6-diaminopimelate ligase [Lentilactobacillus sp. SPB1-3]